MDTSVLQFYPMLFALATDIMDMLGDMVFERIKCKAEVSEDGTRICYLPGLHLTIDSISPCLSLSFSLIHSLALTLSVPCAYNNAK